MPPKTVYILGAGFSKHAGYPLGGEIGQLIIEDPEIMKAGEHAIPPKEIFQKGLDAYQQHKAKNPEKSFEEVWMSIEEVASQPGPITGEGWAIEYFRYAISEAFRRLSSKHQPLPSAYVNFFTGVQRKPTYEQSDTILYINWDTIPEIYCGLCYTGESRLNGTPAFRPIGISSEDPNVRISPGIQVLRPAGGIHLVLLPDGGTLSDRFGREDNDKFVKLTNRPPIFLLKDLGPKTIDAIRTQIGDNPHFMVYPGVDPSHHPFFKGQLNRAQEEIKQSDRIIVVGYRFPNYDRYLRRRFEEMDFSKKEVIIVDPQDEAANYIRNKWRGISKLQIEKERFEDSFLSQPNWNKG